MNMSDGNDSIEYKVLKFAMNPPEPPDGQTYIEKDYRTGELFVICPYCGKKNLKIRENTRISNLTLKCKGSSCKKLFEVNV